MSVERMVALRVSLGDVEDCIEDVQGCLFGTAYSHIHNIIEREDGFVTVLVKMDCSYPFVEDQWRNRWDSRYENRDIGPAVRLEAPTQ